MLLAFTYGWLVERCSGVRGGGGDRFNLRLIARFCAFLEANFGVGFTMGDSRLVFELILGG